MKITIQTEKRTISAEIPEDSTIYELYEVFDTLAIGATFSSLLVENVYLEKADAIEKWNKLREEE